MSTASSKFSVTIASDTALRIGFIALSDAAPIIVAQEQGFFRRQGLKVTLSREVGWATIRDKIIYRELDASHALAAMVVSTTLGLTGPAHPCVTACILNTNGNCITLSETLWNNGVRDAATLRDEIIRCRHERALVFGVVYPYSTHHILICDWLKAAGINPQRDVRIVTVPPPQLFRNLAAGTIDGYCVGDPWNSLAVREKAGWMPALSTDLSPGHPEKVFMVSNDFATTRDEEHLALIAAIHQASRLCDDPAFRPELVRLLARREYLNVPERVIAPGLVGPLHHGHEQYSSADTFIQFHRDNANDPTPAKAAWLIEGLIRHGFIADGTVLPARLGKATFRSDLFQRALQLTTSDHHENTALAHA